MTADHKSDDTRATLGSDRSLAEDRRADGPMHNRGFRHVLDLRPGEIGLIGSAGAVGGALEVVMGRRLVARFGAAHMAWAWASWAWPFVLLLPLAQPGWSTLLFPLGWFVVSAGILVYNVSQVSLRQTITSEALLGRMNATLRFLGFGSAPVGRDRWWADRTSAWTAGGDVGGRSRGPLRSRPAVLAPTGGGGDR
jgi:hypothetical protein